MPGSNATTSRDGICSPPEDLRPLSLRLNFSWTFVANVVYSGCQFGLLVALARLGSTEMVGRYALGLAITAPIFMFASLSLATIQATDAGNEYNPGQYIGLRLATSALALLGVGLVVWFAGYGPEVGPLVMLIGLAKTVESLSDILYGIFMRRERLDLVAQSMIVRGILSLACFALALRATGHLEAAVLALIIVWLAVLVGFDRPHAARLAPLAPAVGRRTLLGLAWLALPLGLVTGANSFGQQLPRLFLERVNGETELGIFAAIASLAAAGNIVAYGLSRSAAPRLAQYWAEGAVAEFRALVQRLVSLGALVGLACAVGALLVGRPFLGVVFGSEYAARKAVLIWIVLATGMNTTGTFLGTAVTAARKFPVQLLVHSGKIAVIAFVCLLFGRRYGALAAALALLAGGVFSNLAFLAIAIRLVRRRAEEVAGARGLVMRPGGRGAPREIGGLVAVARAGIQEAER